MNEYTPTVTTHCAKKTDDDHMHTAEAVMPPRHKRIKEFGMAHLSGGQTLIIFYRLTMLWHGSSVRWPDTDHILHRLTML